jgi:hypothetical protein
MSTADALRNAAERLVVHGNAEQRKHIEQVKRIATTMADQLDAGALDPFLRHVKTIAQIEFILGWQDNPEWTPSLLNKVVALKLDAGTMTIARDALLALDAPVMAMAGVTDAIH